jgi:tetrachloro-p-hydroquinone reductive dehalogenase
MWSFARCETVSRLWYIDFEGGGVDYYYYPNSHWSRVISLVIAEKGLDVTRHVVDIGTNANFEPDYMRINPKGVVPTIVDGDTTVCNSPRIAAYLDSVAGPRLVLDSTRARRWSDELVELPLMLFSYTIWTKGLKGERSAEVLADKVARAGRYAEDYPELAAMFERKQRFFEGFRRELADAEHVRSTTAHYRDVLDEMGRVVSGSQWLAGDDYSFADCVATSVLYRLVDLEYLDHWHGDDAHGLSSYYARLRARPSFAAVFPKAR